MFKNLSRGVGYVTSRTSYGFIYTYIPVYIYVYLCIRIKTYHSGMMKLALWRSRMFLRFTDDIEASSVSGNILWTEF